MPFWYPWYSNLPKHTSTLAPNGMILAADRRMPERQRLRPDVYKRTLSRAPANSWFIVRVSNGEILGSGSTVLAALRDARDKHIGVPLDDIVVLKKGEK